MDSKTEPTLDKDLIEKAATALLKYVSKQQEEKSNDILADKHPLYDASTEICLITKDPQKTFKELVASKNLKRIRKVFVGLIYRMSEQFFKVTRSLR
ncbi:31857_t:CDS:2 [Gigaspora margarita]|uniref:31857_t:CDS:1 n=1 Tax=Gigaspora margarita TaxID=4874 RepID=A0ABN7UT67_GIGMA|nr:31857_t:CDS:2 [Gigaspora margarita]